MGRKTAKRRRAQIEAENRRLKALTETLKQRIYDLEAQLRQPEHQVGQ